jgi:HSP20 family protein
MERIYGTFSRSMLLPAEVDLDKCSATFKNGVLSVVLPKTVESEKTSKNIAIKTA